MYIEWMLGVKIVVFSLIVVNYYENYTPFQKKINQFWALFSPFQQSLSMPLWEIRKLDGN